MQNFWKKNKWNLLSLFIISIFGVFLTFKGVSADSLLDKVGTEAGMSNTSLTTIIGNIIKAVLGLLGFVLVILIIWSGVEWMTAGGDSGKVEKARTRLTNAVIGLAIVMAAYAVANFVISSLTNAVKDGGGVTY